MKINFKKLIIVFVVLLFVGLIAYKVSTFSKYKTDNITINKEGIFNNTININYIEGSGTATFEEMSYHDYFSDYVDKEGIAFKVKYGEDGNVASYYSITKENQLINMLSVDSFELATDEKGIENKKYHTEKNMKKFLKKNEIKDDIDLIKYIKDNYYLKNSLLTPTYTMRNNYIINSLAQSAFPNFESITLIKGDNIKGYIVNISSTTLKAIHLLHGDNQYVIVLLGEEITTPEFVNNLLGSIRFN